jgi:hypothetical protein
LVHYFEADEWDLFDLQKDPAQLRSVFADPAYAATVADLKAEIERLRKLYNETDPMPYRQAKGKKARQKVENAK